MALSPYIAKLEESVDKISWANHEMKTTLEKTLGHIKDEAKKTTKDDVVKASIELLKKMVESIDKFQSGDIVDVINGIFDIVNGILAFASFPGPEGTVIAAIAGPLLSLIGSILSLCFGNKTESQEHMLHRIVTECLKVQTDQELQSLACGEMAKMNQNLVILKKLSEYPTLAPESLYTISQIYSSGVGFLGRLWYFIELGMGSKDKNDASRTARLMYLFATIGFMQMAQLSLLSALYRKAGAVQLCEVTLAVQKDQAKTAYDRMLDIGKMPSERNHLVYSQLHKMTTLQFGTVEVYRN